MATLPRDPQRSSTIPDGLETTSESDHAGGEPPFPIAAPMLDAEQLALPQLIARLFGDPIEPPLLGHYVLLDELGRGGMGVVYLAQDPALDRKVAIKQMGRQQPELRARFEREAKAMAKLAHPNVVQVYEIGESEGTTYIVMEYVEGETLREWLTTPRSRDEILDTFIAAGRGLAAAHEAGIVHRDFKPDNVMVRTDGRVLVMDFGLAGGGTPVASVKRESDANGRELTSTGMVMGTPVYMSPEQWQGGRVDAKTDQFSFCVALWEALHGQRPFDDSSRDALEQATTSGALRKPKRAVPQWIQQVLERGLAVEPKRRFGSMQALLDELGTNPAGRVWRVGGLLVSIVVLVWLAWALIAKAQDLERAQRSKQQLDEVEDSAQSIVEGQAPFGRIAALVDAIKLVSRFGPHADSELGPDFVSGPALVTDALLRAMAVDELWGTRHDLVGHQGQVLDVAWSPDGRWLATGGEDRTVRVWDADTGAPRHVWKLDGDVQDVEFSPDGAWLIASTDDERVSVFHAESGRLAAAIEDCSGAFALTRDGELVTAGTDNTVRVWAPGSDQLRIEFTGHDDEIRAIASSPDGRYVATAGSDADARSWDLVTGQLLQEMPHPAEVTSVEFSHDNELLATATEDGSAKVWRRDTGEFLYELGEQHREINSIEFSANDDRLLVAYGGVAELWDIHQHRLVRDFYDDIIEASFSPDGKSVLATTFSGAMMIGLESGAYLDTLHLDYPGKRTPPVARISPDGRKIAIVGPEGKAQIWAPIGGQAPRTMNLVRSNDSPIHVAAVAHNGRFVAAASASTAWVWDASTEELIDQWSELEHPIIGLTAAHDQQFWLITSSSGRAKFRTPNGYFRQNGISEGEVVEVWDIGSRDLVRDLTGKAHQPSLVASRTNDTHVRADACGGGLIMTRGDTSDSSLHKYFGEVLNFALSHGGDLVFIAGSDGISISNTRTDSQLFNLHPQLAGDALAFSPDDRVAATTSGRQLRIWDVATGELVQQRSVDPETIAMGFAREGEELLTITAEGTLERHFVDPLLGACQLLVGTTQYLKVALPCARARVSATRRGLGVANIVVDDATRVTDIQLWLLFAALHVLIPTLLVVTGLAALLRNWAGEHRVRRLLITAGILAPCMLLSILGRDRGSTPLEMQVSELIIFTATAVLACHALLWLVHHQPRRWWLWLGLALGVSFSLALDWNPQRVVVLLDRPGALLPPALALLLHPLADIAGSEPSHGFSAHLDAHADGHHALIALSGFVLALLLTLWLVHRIWQAVAARFGHRFGFERTNLVTLPLLLAAINLVGLALVAPAVLGLRWLEHEADRAALDVTHDNLGCAMAVTLENRVREGLPTYRRWDPKQPTTGERIDFCITYRPWEPEQPHFYDLALELAEGLSSTSIAR